MSRLQRDGVAYASTAVQLREALLHGWRHVVVTAHLDLTELPLRETSICPEGCASPLPDIRDTESIRGNCSDAPALAALAATLDGAPLLPLQDRQCLVLTYEDSLPILIKHMWVDSLYMRIKYTPAAPHAREFQYATLGGLAPLVGAQRWHAQHYITRSTFQGDGLGPAVGVWADENGYIENCTFANLGGDATSDCEGCTAAVSVANVSVTIVNSTFFDPVPLPGSSYVRAWGAARVLLSGCAFAATPELPEAPFYTTDAALVFADQGSSLRLRFEDDGLEVGALPLSALPAAPPHPNQALLQRTDAWFVNITRELGQELPPRPAYPPPLASPPLLQPPSDAPADASNSGTPTTAIIGAAVGVVLLLCAVAVCCVLWLRRRRNRRRHGDADKARAQAAAGEMADMTTTGGTLSDASSLPSGKLAHAWSRGIARAQAPRPREDSGITDAAMPQLAPDAAMPAVLTFIQAQLDSIAPEAVLQEQARLLGPAHRLVGGQSVVAFAEGAFSRQPYIMKFFPVRASFDTEIALRDDPALAKLMPVIRTVHDPARPDAENLPITDRWGRALPPCIMTARGESLVDWLRRAAPDIFQAASVVAHVAAGLREIHAAGYVHRAVKPAHILHLREQNRWTLIDFDRAAAAGTLLPPTYSLPYAPPEVVAAAAAGCAVSADPSQDAWALGVVAFELLTARDAFAEEAGSEEQITAQLLGRAALPWEGARLSAATRQRLGIFLQPVLGLLRRDAAERARMLAFCNACHDIVASHTTTAAAV